MLGFGVGHFLGKTWKNKKKSLEELNVQDRYVVRLKAALILIEMYSYKKMHVKSFLAMLEKTVNEFRPALVLQIHNSEMRNLIGKFVSLLSQNGIHTALLDSVLQIEHEISEETFPFIIAYRLRAFYIPLYVLLKKPPEESHNELEFVTRIEQVLNSPSTQRILHENNGDEEKSIEYLINYPSLCFTSRYHILHSASVLIELETFQDLTITHAHKRKLKESIIRRAHSEYTDHSKDSAGDNLKRYIVKCVHDTVKEFDTKLDRSPISHSIYDVDFSDQHIIPESLQINRIPVDSYRAKIITVLKESIYDGDMNDLDQSDDQEALIKSRQSSDKKKNSKHSEIFKHSIESHDPTQRISTDFQNHDLKVHKYQDCFDELLQIELEPTTEKEWKAIIDTPENKIYQKKLPNSPICMIKAYCTIPYSPEVIFTAIWDTEIRTRWDNLFQEFRIVYANEDYQLLYYMIKTPIGITRRDWLQKRVFIREYPCPGCICIYFISVEDDSMPPRPKVIRAETLVSGYIIRPTVENTSIITIITSNDIKGLIPTSIVNRVASKAPLEWVKSLTKGCEYVLNK